MTPFRPLRTCSTEAKPVDTPFAVVATRARLLATLNSLRVVAKRKSTHRKTTVAAPKVRQRAVRRKPNIAEILVITLELLERDGESGFRLEDLMQRTGISKSSIYLHFGDRDGLLAAAFSKKFSEIVQESLSGLELLLNNVSDPRSMRDALQAATAFVTSPDRFKNRLDRAVIIAGTRGRAAFADELAKAQTALTDRMMVLLLDAQERGLVRLRHSPRTVAQMIQAVTFGRIVAELEQHPSPESVQSWISMVTELLDHLLFDGLLDG
ncbi:MAG: TetR/AcrR family transcriptional regulator [Actinobacteria bacterium]|nr:TetR/AcrR family transcriptional regulator [Actinomycetota bacterium]NCZ86323.1 TetR/AcrR family transcriptional regulator [Actinomycetota bacterium]